MRIKRFLAPDMRRAIQLVRQEHGPDALILSSRSVEGGIEIVSALDYDQSLVAEIAAQSAADRGVATESAPAAAIVHVAADAPREPIDVAPSEAARPDVVAGAASIIEARQRGPATHGSDEQLQGLQQELQFVKEMLREQFAHLAWADLNTFQPDRAVLQRRVEGLGLEPELVAALVDEASANTDPGKAWRTVLLGLARRIRVLPEDPVELGGVVALVGPTGVGKTTTIAKLAARHCLLHGPDSIALVSTDNFRVGAQRQLDAYGVILGVPVRRAESPVALATVLHEQRHRRLVLIDTAGLAPRDCRLAAALSSLHANPGIRSFVVLAANMQTSVMRDAVLSFGGAKLAGAVLTKVDEANSIGGALSVVVEHALPVAWISEGQRVPEDLKLARQTILVAAAASGAVEERRPIVGRTPVRPVSGETREAAHAGV
jgi:flagellar biosynthesis protein FlhF